MAVPDVTDRSRPCRKEAVRSCCATDAVAGLGGPGGSARAWANDWAAAWGATFGLPHFFQPGFGKPWWHGAADAPSLYDTAPLRETLLELVNFDRINEGPTRLAERSFQDLSTA